MFFLLRLDELLHFKSTPVDSQVKFWIRSGCQNANFTSNGLALIERIGVEK